nr:probable tRNA N6-adenosine threonylcarbamoyltransferase, mitochondrial isoform X1 [Tanacetum cinerariifolium]
MNQTCIQVYVEVARPKHQLINLRCHDANWQYCHSLGPADLLAKYGGVAPKMAEEAHSQVIDQVVQDALDKANLTEADLSAVAVTIGPGLSLCLR